MKASFHVLTGVAAVALLTLPGAIAQERNRHSNQDRTGSANRLTADNNFVTKAAQGGMAEVQLGNLAKERGSSQQVKDFGQQMVTDHTKANDELKSIAARKNITLPTGLDAKDQATYDRLSKLNGVEFDKAYMRDMVMDHRKDVSEFRQEADRGTDADLKAFASKTLPTLEHHLQMAESTDAKVKK